MKKLILAGLVALPCLVLGQSPARAQCCNNGLAGSGCYNLAGSFHIKICAAGCLRGWCEKFCPSYCGGPSCCGGGGGYCPPAGADGNYGGYGYGGCLGLQVPGPWYTYWPYGDGYQMASAGSFPGWNYEQHFNAPAPTGYPYWPAPQTAPQVGPGGAATQFTTPAAYQPVAYYPNYWYGH